jgi:hypothetical protein
MWKKALESVPEDLNLAIEGSYYYLRVSAYAHLQDVRPRTTERLDRKLTFAVYYY